MNLFDTHSLTHGFQIGQSLPIGTSRTVPFAVEVIVPDLEDPPVTVQIAYADGLRGPGQPVTTGISFSVS